MTTKKKNRRLPGDGSIYHDEKKDRWIAQLNIGYDGKTGRMIKRTKTCLSKREARAALEELTIKYASPNSLAADRLTVAHWLTSWFETYSRPQIRADTAASYQHMLNYAIAAIGRLPLSAVTSFELQRIITKQMNHHYRTAQYFRTIMRMAFKRAVKLKLIDDNPADDLELPKRKPKKPFIRPSRADREALLNAASPYYCWRYLLLTEYFTGLRRGELLALHWQDIDLAAGKLRVRYALANGAKQPGKEAPVYLAEPKTTTSKRELYIPAALCQELTTYKAMQAAKRLQAQNWEHPDLVFTRENGRYINPAVFSSDFCNIRRKLGIKTTFHMLRHDMASRMKASGKFDFKDIQEQLGHSTIQITMDIYTHIDEESKSAVGKWLESDAENLIGSPKGTSKYKAQ
ncbi:MAG: site-specific integrase [Selenomonas sp.]|uniref:site-specific integrase n=1 Tax=Selenomonas sp. TaxID=2053611 RepID=UPI0025F591E4|nr:site-specific integrase [Selenomonas sp.]MCR5437989.1 site-specific integrase [Selenomonas sp.]